MVVSKVFSQGFVTDRSFPHRSIYFYSGQIIYITLLLNFQRLRIWINRVSSEGRNEPPILVEQRQIIGNNFQILSHSTNSC